MEKYTKAQMEVIEFEAEDVITTSDVNFCIGADSGTNCPTYDPHDSSNW